MSDEGPSDRNGLVQVEIDRLAARRAAIEAEAAQRSRADLDSWRLCDELTVHQAALLIAGVSPSSEAASDWLRRMEYERPLGSEAARHALINAILARKVKATLRFKVRPQTYFEDEPNPGEIFAKQALFDPLVPADGDDGEVLFELRSRSPYYICEKPDWDLSTVSVDEIKRWLGTRGVSTGFFFPQASLEAPDFLDPSHGRYAPKLAAAVKAWLAVTETGNRSPKNALTKWLNEHAVDFGLTDEDGNPTKTAVEEIAKVANWKAEGGAPRTGG